MGQVLAAFAEYLVKFVIFVAVAGLGVFCGDKYRKKKNADAQSDKES